MSKRKNKRKSEPEVRGKRESSIEASPCGRTSGVGLRPTSADAHTKAVIEEAIRIRTRMRIRDCEGKERIFRSTVAETEEGAEDETEADTG